MVRPTTIQGWADALKISTNAARRHVRAGRLPLDGSLAVDDARRLIEDYRAAARTRPKSVPASEPSAADMSTAEAHAALKREQARLHQARRVKLELETEALAGRLLPLAEVEERWLAMTSRWVATVRAIPARAEADMAALTGLPADECRRFLAGVIGRALDEARLHEEL